MNIWNVEVCADVGSEVKVINSAAGKQPMRQGRGSWAEDLPMQSAFGVFREWADFEMLAEESMLELR